MTQVIGMIALKGGVGKTTCTAAIGSALAYTFGKKVLLVDANFSAPNLGFYFDIINPEKTIHDVLHNRLSMRNAVHEYDDNLHIIPAALMYENIKNAKFLKEHIDKIKDDYDIVLIDSSPHLGYEIFATIDASDRVYTITTPDIPSLSTTLRLLKILRGKKTFTSGIILNKVKKERYQLQRKEIERTSEASIAGIVPYDSKVEIAMHKPRPLHKVYPRAPSAIAFNSLAAQIIDEEYEDPRFLSKLKKLFRL